MDLRRRSIGCWWRRERAALETGVHASDLIRRPQLTYQDLAPFDTERPPLADEVTEQVEIQIKYEGYIQKQLMQVEQMRKLESRLLPEDICYEQVRGLRLEAIEKLQRVRPYNIGQASRISGVSPADISVAADLSEQPMSHTNSFF